MFTSIFRCAECEPRITDLVALEWGYPGSCQFQRASHAPAHSWRTTSTDTTVGRFDLVYDAFSFTIAATGAATVFFFISRSHVSNTYKGTVNLVAGRLVGCS